MKYGSDEVIEKIFERGKEIRAGRQRKRTTILTTAALTMSTLTLAILLIVTVILMKGQKISGETSPEPKDGSTSPPSTGVGGLPPAGSSWMDHPEAMEATAASVVKLEVYDKNGTKIASGTGFAAIEPGYLVTAYHVVSGMEYAKATGEDGVSFTLTEIIGEDEAEDTAVLKLPDGLTLPVIDIGGEPLRGEPAAVIGSQAGVKNLITIGNYSGLYADGEHTRYLFSTPVAGGCSGAPLINSAGYVIGLVSGTYDNAQNLNIAVPMARAVELYNQYTEDMEQ